MGRGARSAISPQCQPRLVGCAAGWVCAVASSSAVVILTPLKQVEPFVVRVDNTTGVVDVVPVYAGGAAHEESVTRYF